MIDLNAVGSQQEIIGVMINEGATVSSMDICTTLRPEAFTLPLMRLAFEVLSKSMANGTDTDLVSTVDKMERVIAKHKLFPNADNSNIFGIMAEIAKNTASKNATGHAKHLKSCLSVRLVQKAMIEAQESIQNGSALEEITSSIDKVLYSVQVDSDTYRPTKVSTMVKLYADHLEDKMGEIGPRSGFSDLDRKLGRVAGGNVIVVAGRPSTGKTEFGCAWALNAARNEGKNVLFMSQEMTKEEIMDRFVAITANISPDELEEPTKLSKKDSLGWSLVGKALTDIEDLGLTIQDEPSLTIPKLRSVIKETEVMTGRKVDIVVLDYVQLMVDNSISDRIRMVAEISMQLKKLAKDLNLVLIELAQLNRKPEDERREPRKSDLADSGQIEKDADKVILLHRDYEDDTPNQGLTKIILDKNRQGKKGSIALDFVNGHFYNSDRTFLDKEDLKAMEKANEEEKNKKVVGKKYN